MTCEFNSATVLSGTLCGATRMKTQVLTRHILLNRQDIYLFALAIRSSSSFFLMAKELDEPLAALMISSARHSAIVLMLRKAAAREPWVMSQMAWLTRRMGDTSTAWRRTTPPAPTRVESSRGDALMMASTSCWMGLLSVRRLTMSKACWTMRTAMIFLPLLRPCIMSEQVRRSTIGHWAFLKRFCWKRPAVWGTNCANFGLTAM